MDNTKNTRNIFDKNAKLYQDKFMEFDRYQPSLEVFNNHLKNDSKVIDIGCGPGNISAYLLKKRPDLKVLGIDLSSKMLEFAKANLPSAEFQQLDCRDIGELQKNFDAVICGFCLPYLSREESFELLNQIQNTLNAEGILYLSTMVAYKYCSHWVGSSRGGDAKLLTYYHQADQLKDSIENTGFIVLYEHQMEEQERDGHKFRDQIFICKKIDEKYLV